MAVQNRLAGDKYVHSLHIGAVSRYKIEPGQKGTGTKFRKSGEIRASPLLQINRLVSLIASQGSHRVDVRGPARGNPACEHGGAGQRGDASEKGQRVGPGDSVQPRAQQTRGRAPGPPPPDPTHAP